MIPVLIVGGVFALYLLVQHGQQSAMAQRAPGVQVTSNPIPQSSLTGLEIGSGISVATQVGTSLAANIGTTAVKAIPIIGTVIGTVASVLLAQHTARLQGATAENQAIPAAVNAFDADLIGLVNAFNSGQATAAQALAAVKAMDDSIYNYMHSLVGKPGTKWGMARQPMTSNAYATCGKSCTAACCVFNANLHPPMAAIYCWLSGQTLQEVGGDTYASQNHVTSQQAVISVPTVYPPDDKAYGTFTRQGYTVTLTPIAVSTAQSNHGILAALGL